MESIINYSTIYVFNFIQIIDNSYVVDFLLRIIDPQNKHLP